MSADEVMDQLFLDFKIPRLWVTQQCRSSTPPPISGSGRHIDTSDLDSSRGGNKYTLRGGKSADQNRPPICYPLSKTADLAAKRTGQIGGLLPCVKTTNDEWPQVCWAECALHAGWWAWPNKDRMQQHCRYFLGFNGQITRTLSSIVTHFVTFDRPQTFSHQRAMFISSLSRYRHEKKGLQQNKDDDNENNTAVKFAPGVLIDNRKKV